MPHIGCGADVIRQRRRKDQQRIENEAKGIYTYTKRPPPDFVPARNKKYLYYTPLRNANIFSEKKQLSVVRKRAIYAVEKAESRLKNESISSLK